MSAIPSLRKKKPTEVVLHRTELSAFDLPPVCVLSGSRDDVRFRPVRFLYTPPIAYAGLLLGVLPALIFAQVMRKRARGSLPMADAPFRLVERSRRLRVVVGFAFAATVATIVAGIVASDDMVTLAGIVGTVGAIIAAVVFRDKAARCLKIEGDYVLLDLPSVEAAHEIEAALAGEGAALPPGDATCPRHADAAATGVCRRCGDFTCAACACYARHTAPAFCPDCFERRMREVDLTPASDPLAGPNAALLFGILSLVPGCWIAQLSGFLTSVIILLGLHEKKQIGGRRRTWVGLVLATLGGVITLGLSVLGGEGGGL
jgi:hypothetical protein